MNYLKKYIPPGGFFSSGGIQVLLIFLILLIQPYKKLHSIYDLLLLLSLVFVIVAAVKGRFPRIPRVFIYIWGVYTLSIVISTIFSIDLVESLDGIRSEYGKQMIVFALFLPSAAENRLKIRAALAGFLISGIIMSTIGFAPYFFGALASDDGFNRLLSFSGSFTRLAYFYTLFVPFLILILKKDDRKWNAGIYALIILALAATFFTKTRAGWIVVPLGLYLAAAFAKKWRALFIMAGVMIVGVALLFSVSPELRKRFRDFRELRNASGSFGQRFDLWKSAAKTLENPRYMIIGAGYGKYIFRKIYELHPQPGMEAKSDTHNTFLELLVQRGVLGFAATALVYFYFLSHAWGLRNKGPDEHNFFAFFVAVSIAFAFFSLVDNLYVKETGRYLWQMAALAWLMQSPFEKKIVEKDKNFSRVLKNV